MLGGVSTQFKEHPKDSFERVWQSLFKIYKQMLLVLRGYDFKVEHTGTAEMQRTGSSGNLPKLTELLMTGR